MNICQACNGVIGRDCFNSLECMAIVRDQASRYRGEQQWEDDIVGQLRHRINELENDVSTLQQDADGLGMALCDAMQEVASVLELMDGLASVWGDEGVFRRCRDRLRAVIKKSRRQES